MADYNELGEEVNSYNYDSKSGNVVSVKDSTNAETSYGYSSDGSTLLQTATNINGLNNTTTYGYTLDFLTKLSHNDFDITYDYDNQGRMSRISIVGTEYATMEYRDTTTITKFKQNDKEQTLETILDNDGNLYAVEYNNENLIRNVHSTHGMLIGYTDNLIEEEMEYTYDSRGNLTISEKNNPETYTLIKNTIEDNQTTTSITLAKHLGEEELCEETLNYTYTYDDTIDKNLNQIYFKKACQDKSFLTLPKISKC